jgi:outer membrane receptor protein involved in Fe transport
MKNILLTLILVVTSFTSLSQISGRVSDSQTSESLFGVTVYVKNQQKGTSTDFDGLFAFNNLDKIKSIIEVRCIGYESQLIEIDFKDTSLNIKLSPNTQQLADVTVTHTINRGSNTEIVRMQSKSANVLDGINSEQFKKTPDSKTSDILKRVSGASIQDNKFVIIRGLNDRYNFALLNGLPLPSSESDKRAFSFDIFPSNMLDNLVIYKTAGANLPGEFAGGVINISTIDTKDKVHNFSFNIVLNTISTFNQFRYDGANIFGLSSKNDLPELPNTVDYQALNKIEKSELAKLMNWKWSTNSKISLPIGSISYNLGKEWKLKSDSKFGFVFAINYQNSELINNSIRREFEEQVNGVIQKMELRDSVFTRTTLSSGLLNLSWKINQKHSIKFKNIYSINSENKVNIRSGVREMDNDPRQWEKSTNFWITENNLYTNSLNGTHDFTKIKVNWNVGLSDVRRDIPNLRRVVYRKYSLNEDDTTEQYVAVIQSNGTIPTAAGNMFWSKSVENIYSGNYDFTIPFNFSKSENNFKLGGFHQFRNKDFQSRNFGFSQYKPTGSQFNSQLLILPEDEIFSVDNMGILSNGQGGFKLDEATNVDDSYWANSLLNAGYLMIDSKISEKFRFILGTRVESYNQKFNYIEFGSNRIQKLDTTVVDFLPSINGVYSITKKMNLRIAYSKTVSRPEFRELAPFSFYNFVLDNIVSGNTNLKRATIDNLDLRLEMFPGSGQLVSVSGFYKNFENPIETINRTGTSGAAELYFTNVTSAKNFGIECELRKNLGFISKKDSSFFDNFTIYSNFSLIKSEVNLEHFAGAEDMRPLQGQSPYIINSGLFYNTKKGDFSINVSYNMIGSRISIVGNIQEPSIWEKGRNVLDFQLSKLFLDKKLELKINIKDILAQDLIFFQDLNGNRKFDSLDNRWQEINFGQTISFSIKYNL